MQATPVDRPRFRQDLVAEPIEDGGARFIDVMDPDSGTLFRFFEVEYSLACGMDGQRDVAGIVKWAEEELGLKASAKEVNHVISTLGDLGYLERGAAAAAAANAAAAAAATSIAMDLERGVVHAKSRPNTPVPDVELGGAGTRPPQGELPRAPELELGAPGTTAPARPAAAKVEDIPLGKPGKTEKLDVDLAAEMPVSAAAVKEAVRQSQVMKAVDIPPELAAELEKPAAKPEPSIKSAEPKVEAKPAAEAKPAQKPAEAKPAQKPAEAKPAQKPAEAKPAQKPAEAKPVTPQPPPASGSPISPVLIAALVLVFLGLGGLALWKFVFAKKDTSQTTGQVETTPEPEPAPPPPPPVETAKLALEQPGAEEVKPVAPGRVATIVANDTAVKEGDPIARLDGYKPVEAQLASIEKALTKAKDAAASAEKERDAAQTAGNKNGVTSAEKKLAAAEKTITEQEAKLATAKAALDKFLIKAPTAGKVTAVAKARAKVTPTDVIATLTPEPVLVATFKSAGEVVVGTQVLLGLAGSDQQLSCAVVQSGGDGVKVACTKDAATEGAEVTYAGVDPNAPAPDAPPPGDTPEHPEAGSAEPAAGSAAEDVKIDEPADAPEEPKVEEKKAEKKPARRPRPRPRPRPPVDEPADTAVKPAGSGDATAAGSSTPAGGGSAKAPADKPADPPPPPAAPAGSGTP